MSNSPCVLVSLCLRGCKVGNGRFKVGNGFVGDVEFLTSWLVNLVKETREVSTRDGPRLEIGDGIGWLGCH